jgi:hypothetical protein
MSIYQISIVGNRFSIGYIVYQNRTHLVTQSYSKVGFNCFKLLIIRYLSVWYGFVL